MTKKSFSLRNVVVIAICLASVAMFMGCKKENPDSPFVEGIGNSKSIRVQTPVDSLLGEIKQNYKSKKITFTPSEDAPSNLSSHAQGYARYRGSGYDYHIFAYSNVAGQQGYLYITGNQTFTLKVPNTVTRFKEVSHHQDAIYDPHFNHTCGIQVIGDYLVVPVIPSQTHLGIPSFYDAAIIYLYDLTSLKSSTPTAPIGKEILQVAEVNGGSLSGAGIIDLPKGGYALGLMTDNNLDIYLSTSNDIWNTPWNAMPKKYQLKASKGDNHYQGIGLFLGEDEQVYVLGGDKRSGEDWVDLYQLTNDTEWISNGQVKSKKEIHLTAHDASFYNGCAIEIKSRNEFIIYAVDDKYSGGGININWWDNK